MNKLIRILAVVVDTKKALFYKEDGTAIEIYQGDARLRPILDRYIPLLQRHGYVDIDFGGETSWSEFEEKSKGGIKFFKIAKQKLKEIFGKKTIDPMVVGTMPHADTTKTALEEIMAHATPVSAADMSSVAQQRPTAIQGNTPNDRVENDKDDPHFDKSPDTIVAVTKTGKVVPGVERIHSQFASAAKDNNPKGMMIFMERLGKVIKDRSHTVEELLRFMERGDLPIADDGNIIIYKKLTRKTEGTFVDGHTGKVIQRVGSLVFMKPENVDPNRRNECSNGLHVARRGYIKSFSGDVIVLAKVRPEDVIAVPQYDANKMRVCAYHIIAELDAQQYAAINSNRPLSDAEGGVELLSKMIAGKHIGIIEKVEIGGPYGTNLKITQMREHVEPKAESQVEGSSKKPRKKASKKLLKKPTKKTNPKRKSKMKTAAVRKPLEAAQSYTDSPVDVRKVAAKVADPSLSLSQEKPKMITKADAAKTMWAAALGGDKNKARELLKFKKDAKKSWTVLGLDEAAPETLKAIING